MAICDLCNREMTTADSCSVDELHRDGEAVAVVRYGKDPGWGRPKGRCSDCGVLPGGFHHVGCDIQSCPGCRGQLISCGCSWDELGGSDDEDAVVLDWPTSRPVPVQTLARPPLAAVVAPLRARHHDLLRRLARWALAHGRPCDLDVAALCLEALDEHRSGNGSGSVLLDRPTVHQILWADVWNSSQMLGALLPEAWPVELWTMLGWLDDEKLLDSRSAPLDVLREPLQCFGGLDGTGHPRPPGTDSEIACQCYVPYDANLPPGLGQLIVGHDPESFEQLLAPAWLRAPSETPSFADLQPLYLFARRLRRERAVFTIHVEEFSFVGVAPTGKRTPELWLYRHEASRRGRHPLIVDAAGEAWCPHPDKRFRLGYRWARVSDTVAVLRAVELEITEEDG
jgi:hypothetical protein